MDLSFLFICHQFGLIKYLPMAPRPGPIRDQTVLAAADMDVGVVQRTTVMMMAATASSRARWEMASFILRRESGSGRSRDVEWTRDEDRYEDESQQQNEIPTAD